MFYFYFSNNTLSIIDTRQREFQSINQSKTLFNEGDTKQCIALMNLWPSWMSVVLKIRREYLPETHID